MMTILRMVTGVFAALAGLLGRRRVAATPPPAVPMPPMPDEWELPEKLKLRRAAAWHGKAAESCRSVGDDDGRVRHAAHAARYLSQAREAEAAEEARAAGEMYARAAREAIRQFPPTDGALHEFACNAFDPPDGRIRVTARDGEVRVEDGDPPDEVWVTAKGERIHPSDMGNGHLVNTIRFIRRKAHSRMIADRRSAPCDAMGDAPGMLDWIGKRRPAYEAMVREAARRGLEV